MTDIKDFELYDWFAGQALAGILSNSHYPPQSSGEPMDQYVARVTDGCISDRQRHDQGRPQAEKGTHRRVVGPRHAADRRERSRIMASRGESRQRRDQALASG